MLATPCAGALHAAAMSSDANFEQREFELSLAVFSVSAALVGVCLTGIGLLQVVQRLGRIGLLGDELLATDCVAFLASCVLSFLSFRVRDSHRRQALRRYADGVFLFGLAVLTVTAFLITFTVIR